MLIRSAVARWKKVCTILPKSFSYHREAATGCVFFKYHLQHLAQYRLGILRISGSEGGGIQTERRQRKLALHYA